MDNCPVDCLVVMHDVIPNRMLKMSASLSCSFGLLGLSGVLGLSCLCGLSCLFNWFGSKNERHQTNQLTRETRLVSGVQTNEI